MSLVLKGEDMTFIFGLMVKSKFGLMVKSSFETKYQQHFTGQF